MYKVFSLFYARSRPCSVVLPILAHVYRLEQSSIFAVSKQRMFNPQKIHNDEQFRQHPREQPEQRTQPELSREH